MTRVVGAATGWRDRKLADPVHGTRTAAALGVALGVTFPVCFLTGLWSHLAQHPVSWFDWPAQPAWGYRVTQGLHVASGIASIPLLLAKLWTVYPHLLAPLGRRAAELVARVSLVPLVGGSLFMLFTGFANIARWYPWPFFFPRAHYWMAWITIGALVVHVGTVGSSARAALTREGPDVPASPQRRAVLGWAFGASAALTVVTAGQTVPLLRRAVLFAPRRGDKATQGLPVNRAAAEAGVTAAATDPGWRLVVEVDGREAVSLDLAAAEAWPRHTQVLPIACVEGWSTNATWRGIRVRDLLDAAGAPPDRDIQVQSLESGGLYGSSVMPPTIARHPDTLLALELNGERLNLDHGYPLRLIAPNRPGVLQTKWVSRLVVT